jgi:hypothetical protein
MSGHVWQQTGVRMKALSDQEMISIASRILSQYGFSDFADATANDFRLAVSFIETFEKEYGTWQPIRIVPASHISRSLNKRVALIYDGWTKEAENLIFSEDIQELMSSLN